MQYWRIIILKHVLGTVVVEIILRMFMPAIGIGGFVGGIYDRIIGIFNPEGDYFRV